MFRGRDRRRSTNCEFSNRHEFTKNETLATQCSRRNCGRSLGKRSCSQHDERGNINKSVLKATDNYASCNRSLSIHPKLDKRNYIIRYKTLDNFLCKDDRESDNILLQLLKKDSGYENLINLSDVRIDFVILIFKILFKLCKSAFSKETLLELLNITFNTSFTNVLAVYIMKFKIMEISVTHNFLSNLYEVCYFYQEKRPFETVGKFDDIINAILLVFNENINFANEITIFKEFQEKLNDVKCRFNINEDRKAEKRLNKNDILEPPDDFRSIPIMPTVEDINECGKPFLRKNIVQGKYNDVNHYLDIQFRLLREDFVRPLREGIEKFRHVQGKVYNKDVKVYKKVKIVKVEMVNQEFIYYVSLNLPRNLVLENSKRLLYGNVICISNDNFKTLIFGYVADRDIDNLKKSLIGVKFEQSLIDFNCIYDMAESKAFFIAYKYVLETLQNIKENDLPLQHYLIGVSNDYYSPSYLKEGENTFYDLSIIKDLDVLNIIDYYGFRRNYIPKYKKCNLEIPELANINISLPIENWPSSQLLGLDDSQKTALHGALTRELSIIQGPPGTGKTFIGLKIIQILLHNSDKWNRERPILVVCYTNHALDQFLEGILSFTSNIVRVGSMSKNKELDDYQINKLAREMNRRNLIPNVLQCRISLLNSEIKQTKESIAYILNGIKELKNPQGIFSLKFLRESLPSKYAQQIENIGLDNWLMDMFSYYNDLSADQPDKYGNYDEINLDENIDKNVELVENVDLDNEEWKDAEEFVEQIEMNRLIDQEIDISVKYNNNVDLTEFYKITLDELKAELNRLMPYLMNEDLCSNIELHYECDYLSNFLNMMKIGMKMMNVKINEQIQNLIHAGELNLLKLRIPERWQCYKLWIEDHLKLLVKRLHYNKLKLDKQRKALNEMREYEHIHIMKNSAIIGMTTTGAARCSQIIQAIQPEIVIIEEAAEILEAHVITSLTSKCKHLIMIGDHQQLKPSATVYELATKYNLETSLFERMIKNGVKYDVLKYQHRMRPSISKLLVPHIYANLKDDVSVHGRGHIKGITKDVFFIDHQLHEALNKDDNNSHENIHEATFIMALCKHILLQGVSPAQITILTPYSGQFFLLRKIKREYPICASVNICVVDNFQGEENDIILLSLVRSNTEENIGFLKIENRVCVALSRAKNGFYIIGNMSQLCAKSELWKNINKTLTNQESIASSLTLECINHNTLTNVSNAQDFRKYCPEGGCLRSCSFTFECGHPCPRTCHVIQDGVDHKKCEEICNKNLCDNDEHLCKENCWKPCKPCNYMVTKTLPCNHQQKMYCSVKPEDFKCVTKVEKKLPQCGHINTMRCFESIETWSCSFSCETRPPCGHVCKLKCHVKNDPDHENYKCLEDCDENNKDCSLNHKCAKKCFEECGKCVVPVKKILPCNHTHNNVKCSDKVDEIVCKKTCNKKMECGHFCTKECCLPCGDCKERVKKIVSTCGHKIKIACGTDAKTEHCYGLCTKILPCGHNCMKKCKDDCTVLCKKLVPCQYQCPHGHNINIPCHKLNKITKEEAWLYCSENCNHVLDCDHVCRGKCGKCFNGRIHIQCTNPCNRNLVCGHICKFPCGFDCPPCKEMCEFKCVHNACNKKCSIPCAPCKAPCKWQCSHKKCKNKCKDKCSEGPCDQPCKEQLKCGHPCIGFCGDPCPPLCRICDFEKLTEFQLLCNEENDDARFVLLKDCGHVIEAEGLESWLEQNKERIGMKQCPRCKKSIYNTQRYKSIINDCYLDVEKIKKRFFAQNSSGKNDKMNKIKRLLTSPNSERYYRKECRNILKSLGLEATRTNKSKKYYSDTQINLALGQAEVLTKAVSIKQQIEYQEQRIKCKNYIINLIDLVVDIVLNVEIKISNQLLEEITCELQRIEILPAIYIIEDRMQYQPNLRPIHDEIKILMDPTIKYDSELERKVKVLLKKAEPFIKGGLGISDQERIMIVNAMQLKQGHWYKCSNNHIYCITECGGAMETASCPECGNIIGGSDHRLTSDNSVASEMDGATRPAWS